MLVARHVALAAPLAACLLLASAASVAAPPHAPSKAERAKARDAYDRGTAAFDKGDYQKALDGFVKANALIPSVQALYWIARAQDKLGQTQTAIDSYEAILARDDFSKLSEDKASTLRERLAALKPPPPPPVVEPPPPPPVAEAPAASEPAAPAASEPSPSVTVNEPPPLPADTSLEPRANSFELGVLGGMLFVAGDNNLVERGHQHVDFKVPVWQAGVRAAYFPVAFLGVEAEWAHGFGSTEPTSLTRSHVANLDVARAHLIGQLPGSRFVPFALLGGGFMNGTSKLSGTDLDFLLQAGLGAKLYATELLVPRIDFRLGMAQKEGGGFGDGVALHPEVLLGLSFRFGG